MLPFFPLQTQKILSILFKVIELLDIIRFYQELEQKEPNPAPPLPFTMTNFLDVFKRQLNPKEQEQMDSILNMVQMMSMLQSMQADSGQEGGSGDGMSQILKGMLTPEQQSMFDSLSAMFPEGESPKPQKNEEE